MLTSMTTTKFISVNYGIVIYWYSMLLEYYLKYKQNHIIKKYLKKWEM